MTHAFTMSGTATELSIVVPSYNERPNVAPLIAKLDAALDEIAWEVIYVDDDSPDGTADEVRRIAATDTRVRCIRRFGRRGLSSAVIEGALSSSASFIAVMDGDLQHDETVLPAMLAALRDGSCELVVASRYVSGGDSSGLGTRWRHALSDGGIRLAQAVLLLHGAAPAVRAAGAASDRTGLQDPARPRAQRPRTAARARSPERIPQARRR
jgi:dolichol-phosphate mannosyltransferase